MGKDTGDIRSEIADTRDRMGNTVDAIAYKADVPHRMQDAIGERVEGVKSSISGSVEGVRSSISDSVDSARERVSDMMPEPEEVRDAAYRAWGTIRENPLGLMFSAAAVGFVLGSILPAGNGKER